MRVLKKEEKKEDTRWYHSGSPVTGGVRGYEGVRSRLSVKKKEEGGVTVRHELCQRGGTCEEIKL